MSNSLPFTRRRFLTSSAIGAGLVGLHGLLPSAASNAQGGSDKSSSTPDDKRLSPLLTPALSDFIADGDQAKFPEEIRELGRQHILDTLAAIVICRDLPAARVARRFAIAHTGGIKRNAATIPGHREKVALIDAVFAGAITGHAAEINDFSPSSLVQPGASVLPASLCLSEVRGCSGEALLRAVIKGYEITCRMTKTIGLRNLQAHGIQTHPVGGTFGTAAACASLLRLPRERINDLLSYCAQQMSGSNQWLMDVDHIEKAFVFAGMPARNGIHAALMVEAGFTGIPDSLDQPGSWITSAHFHGPNSDHNRGYLVEKLGERFELPLVSIKRYASAGPTQAAVQGLTELMKGVDRRDVEKVEILIPSEKAAAFNAAEMPNVNLRYLSAVVMIDGHLGFDAAQSHERMANDAEVRNLMSRVQVSRDPSSTKAVDTSRAARVTVKLRNGKTLETYVPAAKGHPDSPMTRAEVEEKATELMAPVIGSERTGKVIARVRTLEKMERAGDLLRMIAA